MRKRRKIGVLLIITSLIIMLLPVPEADAATSASDFNVYRGKLTKYNGKEKTVVIPSSVEVIGEGAFQENDTIERVTIPSSVKKIEAYAFWDCDRLETVELGTGLTEVGDFAFNNCKGLRYITIPSNVNRIGIQSFAYCEKLEDITIPFSVTEIREDSFDGDYLLNIHCEAGSYADKYARDFYERQKKMAVYATPSSTPSMGTGSAGSPSDGGNGSGGNNSTGNLGAYDASSDVLGSTHVVANQAVVLIQNVGLGVMSGAANGTAAGNDGADGSTTGNDGTAGSANAGGTWNGGVGDATGGTEDLRKVPERAFYRNDALEEAEVVDGVLEIGRFAYARSGLSRVVLPQGLEKIDYAAFYHCGNLAAVELPDTVMEVAPKAFDHTAWVDDFLKGSASADEGNGSDGSADLAGNSPFLISGGVLVAYRGNAAEVEIPEGVRVVAGEVFADHLELKKIILPKSLLVLGDGAFRGCGLETVEYGGDALSETILEEQVTLAENSAPPVQKGGFRWTWLPAGILLLAGGVCAFGRGRRKG